jgi:hypothetical protein
MTVLLAFGFVRYRTTYNGTGSPFSRKPAASSITSLTRRTRLYSVGVGFIGTSTTSATRSAETTTPVASSSGGVSMTTALQRDGDLGQLDVHPGGMAGRQPGTAAARARPLAS